MFLNNGGQRGPQRSHLTGGVYFINTEIFTIVTSRELESDELQSKIKNEYGFQLHPIQLRPIVIQNDEVGIVTTRIGKPLLDDDIAAPKLKDLSTDITVFQDAEMFVEVGGYSGLQLELLMAGTYYINPLFATVEKAKFEYVPEDKVGVLISSYGKNLGSELEKEVALNEGSFSTKVINDLEDEVVGLQTDEQATKQRQLALDNLGKMRNKLVQLGSRGVLSNTLPTGYHPINTKVFKVETVPTNEIILEWTNKEKPPTNYDAGLNAIEIFTKDKYKLQVEVTQSIKINEENAPVMVVMVGAQGEEDATDGSINNKSKSIKSLVSKVLASSVQQFFVNAAAAFTAYEFIEAEQEKIRHIIARDIKTALIARGVTALNTTFSVLGDSIPEALQERIAAEQENINEIENLKLESIKIKQEEETEVERHRLQRLKDRNELEAKKDQQKKTDFIIESELKEKRIREELRIALEKEDIQLEMNKLKTEIELKGGPALMSLPDILKNFPKQLEHVQNLVISGSELKGITEFSNNFGLLQMLLQQFNIP
ncbi:MAG: SPFH domain-containing protein, partial [Bacteroidota bacterium]